MVKQAATRDAPDAWAAFEGEVLPHADRLFRLAMWFSRNRADAEDVVQDTMMQALKSFHRFQPGTNCGAWLTTILQHIVSNRRRTAGRSIVVDHAILLVSDLDSTELAQLSRAVSVPLARRLGMSGVPVRGMLPWLMAGLTDRRGEALPESADPLVRR